MRFSVRRTITESGRYVLLENMFYLRPCRWIISSTSARVGMASEQLSG